MVPHLPGFTRASSLGPIADFMDRQGGSASRVLREVDLPFALLEQPEIVIPLREQFRFLERAARRTGDAYFGARLGQVVRIKELSAFGAWVCTAETLLQAIERANAGLNIMLQTSTVLTLEQRGPTARWSIEFIEPETDGRHQNELLGISYLIDTVRTYAGRHWRPDVVMTALPAGTTRAGLEDIFGTNVSNGHVSTSIGLDTTLLNCRRRGSSLATKDAHPRAEPKVPGQEDALATIASLTDLALYDGYPRIDWIAAKLAITRRSLQRLLSDHGATFNQLVGETLLRRAKVLLDDGATPITEIALELGYRDPAHFTRAFRRWMGVSPSAYRNVAT
ncbi:MAG: AraC family transcriptional regulator ligand-binding domain-containing protein [Methylovirgula sp.]